MTVLVQKPPASATVRRTTATLKNGRSVSFTQVMGVNVHLRGVKRVPGYVHGLGEPVVAGVYHTGE